MRDFAIVPNSMIGQDSGLSPMDVMVFIVLDLHTDDAGNCYPGQETIAAAVGASTRTVRTSLHQLEKLGWIEITYGNGKANQYHVIPRNDRKCISAPSPKWPETGFRRPRKYTSAHPGNGFPPKNS